MTIDRRFGNTGTIWTAVPEDSTLPTSLQDVETRYVGGTAVGLHVGPSGYTVPVWGWPPQFSSNHRPPMHRVFLASFPHDGRPEEQHRSDGVQFTEIMATGASVTPLASCDGPNGSLAILLQVLTRSPRNPRFSQVRYLVSNKVPNTLGSPTELSVDNSWLFDPDLTPIRGNVRIAYAGSKLAIVSTRTDRVKVVILDPNSQPLIAPDIDLSAPTNNQPGDPPLQGLVRLDIASLRFDATHLSVALTAYLNHPTLGSVTQGVILRLAVNGQKDTNYGQSSGLWVSPRPTEFGHFICAGEFDCGLVGIQDTDLVAFGVLPDGSNLDNTFGSSGVLRHSLGRPLIGTPVIADDGQKTYLFTQRSGDLQTVGCRFDRQGVFDRQSFGSAGLVVLPSDGMPVTPAAAKVSAGRVIIAFTRQIQGLDCDRIPGITALLAADGTPDPGFGAGGFALHSAIGAPAVICPDGSIYYTERLLDPTLQYVAETMNLRRADPAGRLTQTIPISPPVNSAEEIYSLWALGDNSVLIGGRGSPGWLRKLTPAGTPDLSFGVQGIAIPRPGVDGAIEILGVRQDGRIAILFLADSEPRPRIGLLHANGSVDTTYAMTNPLASHGFIEVFGFSSFLGNVTTVGYSAPVRAFLEEDGSILCVASSTHRWTNSPFVHFALRRITITGEYDPSFGLGIPSVNIPPNSQMIIFSNVDNSSTPQFYSEVTPVGTAWMGGKLYLIASGVAGGILDDFRPGPYSVLIVTRWNSDGTKDLTFGTNAFQIGFQTAGYSTERLQYSPRGVIPLSPTQLLVFGEAGHIENRTITSGGHTWTESVIRPPEPALFKVSHPNGIDFTYGQDGAQTMQMQEFEPKVITARLFNGGTPRHPRRRVLFVCYDVRDYQYGFGGNSREKSIFGGIGQFTG